MYATSNLSDEKKITEHLNLIITERNRKSEKFSSDEKEMKSIYEKLENAKDTFIKMQSSPHVYENFLIQNPKLKNLIKEPNVINHFNTCIDLYKTALKEVIRLKDRFSRKTFNIAIVGIARSGKSKFLQTISGLDNSYVPAFAGEPCTGICSIIQNSENEVALIEFVFKSEKELKSEINEILEKYGRPENLESEDFTNKSLEHILSSLNNEYINGLSTEAKIKISDYTKGYNDKDNGYKQLIGLSHKAHNDLKGLPLQVINKVEDVYPIRYKCTDASKLVSFIAKRREKTNERYYKFIAVKECLIKVKFPTTAVKYIQFVDTVGLNDAEIDASEQMHYAIKNHSDAVILLMRSETNVNTGADAKIIKPDISRYIKQTDQKIGAWMALLINNSYTKEDAKLRLQNIENNELLYEFCKSITQKKIVNVAKEVEVKDFLSEFLYHISDNIKDVDYRIESDAKKLTNKAQNSLNKLCEQFNFMISVPAPDNIASHQINKLMSHFTIEVNALYDKYYSSKDVQDIINEKKEICMISVTQYKDMSKLNTLIPDLNLCVEEPTAFVTALGKLKKEVRKIGNSFLPKFKDIEKDFKQQLAEIFLKSFCFDLEELKNAEQPICDKDIDCFRKIAKFIFSDGALQSELEDVFLSIDKFKLDELACIIRILFNDAAEKHFQCTMDVHNPQINIQQSQINIQQPQTNMQQSFDNMNLKGQRAEFKKELFNELGKRIDNFTNYINKNIFFQNPTIVPLRDQICSEIKFFLHYFDKVYQKEWMSVLLNLEKRGEIFKREKKKILAEQNKFFEITKALDVVFENAKHL